MNIQSNVDLKDSARKPAQDTNDHRFMRNKYDHNSENRINNQQDHEKGIVEEEYLSGRVFLVC